jgi:hypothetical protein
VTIYGDLIFFCEKTPHLEKKKLAMKRKLLNELLVEMINDIKSVESLDELNFVDHTNTDVICQHQFHIRSDVHECNEFDKKTFVSNDMNIPSNIEVCCEDEENNNLDVEFPITTILDFLTSEDGELQIKKAKKS